jgi:hypothetical protein
LEHQLGCEHSQHNIDKAHVDERHKAELGHACNVLAEELKQVITCATLHNKENEDIIESLQESDQQNQFMIENMRQNLVAMEDAKCCVANLVKEMEEVSGELALKKRQL